MVSNLSSADEALVIPRFPPNTLNKTRKKASNGLKHIFAMLNNSSKRYST